MRRELKLLLIEMNVLRVEVEQLRAMKREARDREEFLSASVSRLMESRDHWKREAERLTLNLILPANTGATVYLPARDAASVTEDGAALAKAQGVKFLRTRWHVLSRAPASGFRLFRTLLAFPLLAFPLLAR